MKNPNEAKKKQEFFLIIAIVVVLFILLIFEMFFFDGRTEVAEEAVRLEQQLEEMQNDTIPVEQRTVYHALNDIVAMMNDKDYYGLYDMLKDDYKNYYFREYSQFEDFIKVYASEKYYPKYSSYYRDGNLYYIIVDFLKEKYTRDDLLSPMALKVDTIVLEEVGKDEFKFAMNGFVENISHESEITVDDVTFKLLNSVRNTETMKTTILVTNNSDKTVSVNNNNIQLDILGGNSAKVSVSTTITLEPGEAGTLTIEYYMQYNSGKELQGMTFTGVKFNDGSKIENVYLRS